MVGYARSSDYLWGLGTAAFAPAALYGLEKFFPSKVGRGGFPKAMRLAGAIGIMGGFLYFYQRSCCMKPKSRSSFLPCHFFFVLWDAEPDG